MFLSSELFMYVDDVILLKSFQFDVLACSVLNTDLKFIAEWSTNNVLSKFFLIFANCRFLIIVISYSILRNFS